MASRMAGLAHTLRTQWIYILITVIAPIAGVWFALPAKPVDGRAFETPPLGHYVEFRVDRIESLPWTIKTDGKISGRFALGWIGDRAVLLQTELNLPPPGTLRGEVHGLTDEPRTWVDKTPNMREYVYNAIVELQDAQDRQLYSLGAWAFFAAVMVRWLVLGWRWRHPKPRAAPKAMPGPDGGLCVQAPRADAAVASFMRRRGFLVVTALDLLCVFSVIVGAGFLAGALLGFDFLDEESTARFLGKLAIAIVIASPISGLPFVWGIRRRLTALRTVARFGELIDPQAASSTATTWGSRSWVDLWHGFNASHTNIELRVTIGDTHVVYKLSVDRQPAWLEAGTLRVIATREAPYAIVLTSDGEAYVAHRHDRGSNHLRRGDKLPSARAIPPT